jgi:AraC family transcriptional regulator
MHPTKVMSKKPLEINQIEHIKKNGGLPVIPTPALLTSHKSGWRNIHLAQFRQPAWKTPEFSISQHTVILPLPQSTVMSEFIFEGRLQQHSYYVNNQNILIFPANRSYQIYVHQPLEFIHLYLEPLFVSHVAHEKINPDRVEIIFEANKADSLIYQIFLALKADLDVDGSGNGFYADSMATALSAHLLRHYSTSNYQLVEYQDGFSKHKLQRAIDYINANLNENLSLTKIASELDISHYYFCHLFKNSTGITPHQYLIQQRVERAKQLLRQLEKTIADVAMDCGFANPSHFAKHFRKYTGVTPRQFRKI